MSIEKQIKLTTKLYQCRDTVKWFYGDGYAREMADYGKYIKAAMQKHNIGILEAALQLRNELAAKNLLGTMTSMLLISAAVELIEPSKENPLI